MSVRNRLFEQFEFGLDQQAQNLMLMESKLIGYSASFAFSSNYYTFFTDKIKNEIFRLIFNEHLLTFLSKRIDLIMARQTPNLPGKLTSLGMPG